MGDRINPSDGTPDGINPQSGSSNIAQVTTKINSPDAKTPEDDLGSRPAQISKSQPTPGSQQLSTPVAQQKLLELSQSNPHDAKAISCLGDTVKKCITDPKETNPQKRIQLTASPNMSHVSRIFPITQQQAQAIHKEFIYNLRKAQDTIQKYQLELQRPIATFENELQQAMTTHGLSAEVQKDLTRHLHSYFTSDEPVGNIENILAKHYIVRDTDKYRAISQVLLKAQNNSLFITSNDKAKQNKELVRYAETLQSRLSVFCNNMIGGVPGLTQETIDNHLAESIQQIIDACGTIDNPIEQPALEFVEKFSLMMVFNSKYSPFDTQKKDLQDLVGASMAGKIFSGYKYATIESLIAETICNSLPEPKPETKENILESIQSKRNGAATHCDTGGPRGRIDPRQSNSISSQPLPFPHGDSIEFVTNQSFALTLDQKEYNPEQYKQLSQEATGLNPAKEYNELFNSDIERTDESRYRTCATTESVPPYLIDIINNPRLVRPEMTDEHVGSFKTQLSANLNATNPKDYQIFKSCISTNESTNKWEAKPSFAAKMIDNGIRTICSCSGTTILITGQLLKHMDLKKGDRDKMLNSLHDLSIAENPASKLPLDKNLVKLISSISLCMQLQQAHSAGEVIAGLYQMACCIQDPQPDADTMLEGFGKIMELFKKYPEAFLQIPDETTQDA